MLKQTLLDEKSNFEIPSRSVAQLSNCLNSFYYFYNFFLSRWTTKSFWIAYRSSEQITAERTLIPLLFFLAMETEIMPLLRPTLVRDLGILM